MSKKNLTQLLAETGRMPASAAADQLDRAVHQILTQLRRGHSASLPGLGKFKPGSLPTFQFAKPKASGDKKGGSRGKR
jgi:nucleoid DNA-binding protein